MDVYILSFDANRYRVYERRDGRLLELDGRRLAADWRPLRIDSPDEHEYPSADLSRLDDGFVLSARAAEVLGDLVDPVGELLPLQHGEQQLYLLNVTCFSDSLDETHTDFVLSRSGRIMEIDRYVFEGTVAQTPFFKLRYFPAEPVYVTNTVRERVEEAGLTGFLFDRHVWSG